MRQQTGRWPEFRPLNNKLDRSNRVSHKQYSRRTFLLRELMAMDTKFGRKLLIVSAVALLACSDNASPPISGPPIVGTVEVTPASGSIPVGATLQFTAITRDASGNVITGRSMTWSSSSTSAATVSSSGVVTGVATGAATITATSEGKSATAQISVTPVPVGTVEVTPASGSIPVGATLQLTAITKDASDNVITGRSVTWSSSSTSVATVSSSGVVTGVATGAAMITATSEGKSATAQISVTPVPVATVEVTPASGSIPVGATLQFIAIARDASGNVITGRGVTWSSSSTSIATVSSSGLVTGVAAGAATITATSEGKSAPAQISVIPTISGRSPVDRPDALSGPQIHVMYVIPSDGEDRQLDANGTLARSVASFHNWFSQRSNGLAFRFDTFQGELDITFHRLSRTNAAMISFGAFVVTQIEQELRNAGKLDPNKLYIAYYDGGSTYACGGAAWPPRVPGQMAAMYLRGTPGGVECGAQQFVTSPTQFPRYWEFAMLHDLVHTLGIVAETAPNHTSAYPGHVPDRNDLMYSGPAYWIIDATTVIDVAGNDYFGPNVPPGVIKLSSSPFLATIQPTLVPLLEPLSARGARELKEAFTTLPPHPPFPFER